jgi:hypothetical protein
LLGIAQLEAVIAMQHMGSGMPQARPKMPELAIESAKILVFFAER